MALQEELESQGLWLFKYRGTLPLLILAIGTGLFVRTKLNPETFFLEETYYELYYEFFCLLISLVGLAVRVYTVGHTPFNTSGRNTEGQVAETLNTSGSYSMVRHPLYVGNFLMWIGPALLTGNFWFIISFILFYWVYYERIMFAEEQFLRKKFGKVYTDWAASVPAFLPRFSNYIKPGLSFSWKKVLKKEKNGLAATFIIFALFNVLGEKLQDKRDYNYFILAGCVVSIVMYLVLKFMKKKTALLDESGR